MKHRFALVCGVAALALAKGIDHFEETVLPIFLAAAPTCLGA